MYTRTFDRDRPPAKAGIRPLAHLAGRKIWLKFPRPTVLLRQRRDRFRYWRRPRSHGVCHTVHLSKSSIHPLRQAFSLAQGEPRILADPQGLSRSLRRVISTFFSPCIPGLSGPAGHHKRAKKKPVQLIVSDTRLSGGSNTYFRRAPPGGTRQKENRQNLPHTLRDGSLIYTHFPSLSINESHSRGWL